MKEKDNFKNKQEKIKKFLLKEVRLPKLKKTKTEKRKREKNNLSPLKSFLLVSLIVLVSLISGFFAGTFSFVYFYLLENQGMFTIETEPAGEDVGYQAQTSEEAMVIKAVEENAPSVVSIIITKDLPVFEEYYYNPFGDPFGDFLIPQYRQKGTE
jgi:hypothetical protein